MAGLAMKPKMFSPMTAYIIQPSVEAPQAAYDRHDEIRPTTARHTATKSRGRCEASTATVSGPATSIATAMPIGMRLNER